MSIEDFQEVLADLLRKDADLVRSVEPDGFEPREYELLVTMQSGDVFRLDIQREWER